MPYTNKAYFLNKIKESELNNLTADDNGEPDDTRLEDAIDSADSLIDGYLKSVVTLPLDDDEVPESIRQCSYYIASYYLYDNIAFNDIPERISKNYDISVNYLKDIASGKVSIDNVPEDKANTQVSYDVESNRFSSSTF